VIEATLGALFNAAGILIGGVIGLARPKPFSAQTQGFFKVLLGVFTVVFGLRLVWLSVGGTFGQVIKQIVVAMAALVLGNLLGKLLRLQKLSNSLGQHAKKMIERSRPEDSNRFSTGMNVCTMLFCAAPLGILGAIHDALPVADGNLRYFYPMIVKGLMDGLAAMGFVMMFGAGAIFSALPVYLVFGTVTMVTHIWIEPMLRANQLVDSVHTVGGLVICTVAVVIFELRRVQLADYLPALAVAPALTWLLNGVAG
jgi:uncharacterized membrane protein YqgA involved in biofilm formation